jgi:arylsulfatase A-like enzyme
VAFLFVVLQTVWAQHAAAESPERPNIVIILADDLGYADIGVHGCADIPTPNIDSIAQSGVRCTQGYSSHSYCSPMRAGLITGRYQHRFGYENNMPYDAHNRFMGLPVSQRTIAARLKEVGYATGGLGKWHLGAAHPFHPNRRGFDFYYGFLGGGHDYFVVDLQRALGEGYFDALQRNGQPEGLDEYLTTKLSQEAVGFIETHRRGPFFLYLATTRHTHPCKRRRATWTSSPRSRTNGDGHTQPWSTPWTTASAWCCKRSTDWTCGRTRWSSS